MKRRVKKFFVFFDEGDLELFNSHTWNVSIKGKNKYLSTDIKRQKKYFHRMVMKEPKNRIVDHIDNNGLNNRRNNLRIVTHQQNLMNMGKKSRGASFDKSRGLWASRICFNYKTFNLGRFKYKKDALEAYNVASLKIFKEYGKVNKI